MIILQKMYESTIAKKMNLRVIFPRVILYSRQNTLGLGLIRPKTIMVMLAYKLYIGNLREKTRNGKLIRYYEEIIIVEYRMGKIEPLEKVSMNKLTWYQEVNQKLRIRELELVNR